MFNDVAVAAAVLRRDGVIERAAVVDCDVHQGNGTAAIFRDDSSVVTFLLHGARNFPFRKEVSDLDVTFEDGAGDDEYLAALRANLPGVLERHRPDLVFYLAGADPYEGDRLGRLKLTIDGYGRAIGATPAGTGDPPVVSRAGGQRPTSTPSSPFTPTRSARRFSRTFAISAPAHLPGGSLRPSVSAS